jgi:hypothetical protein
MKVVSDVCVKQHIAARAGQDPGSDTITYNILLRHLLYNKNEYMFAEVCSENVVGVWFGRWPVCDSECESS